MIFPATTARALLAGFDALGMRGEDLGREAGLDRIVLSRLDGVFETGQFERLWAAAFRRAPREELPTEVGVAIPFGAFGAVDYLAATSANVEEGFRALARHIRQVSTSFSVEITEMDDGAGMVQLLGQKPFAGRDVSDEFTLATCVARFRTSVSGAFQVRAVRLTRPAPGVPTRHAELLGAPVSYGCVVSALEIPRPIWKLGLRGVDPALQATLRALASHLELGAVDSDLETAIRAHLRVLLPEGCPSAAAVARSVGLTERTLQRKLQEIGTSFARVLDAFREAETERHLAAGLSLTEVALRLGFADQTTWSRAFRRWKGMSPRRWMLAHVAGASQLQKASKT